MWQPDMLRTDPINYYGGPQRYIKLHKISDWVRDEEQIRDNHNLYLKYMTVAELANKPGKLGEYELEVKIPIIVIDEDAYYEESALENYLIVDFARSKVTEIEIDVYAYNWQKELESVVRGLEHDLGFNEKVEIPKELTEEIVHKVTEFLKTVDAPGAGTFYGNSI